MKLYTVIKELTFQIMQMTERREERISIIIKEDHYSESTRPV
ncbi:hypothetical protein F1210_003000 [Clostridioides difficile]